MQFASETPTIVRRWRIFGAALLLAAFASAGYLGAQTDADREFEFARGLIRLKMPDRAEQVMDRLVLRHPHLEERANVIRAEALIQRRRLPAAEEILRRMPAGSPSAQAIRLALADAYFEIGERAKARRIYTEVIKLYEDKTPTDPDVIMFLRDSAYKFAQMLILEQDYLAAIDVYDLLMAVVQDRDMRRQIMLEQSELAIKAVAEIGDLDARKREALNEKAEKNFTEVLWGGMDLWFGRALIAYARFLVLQGDRDEARRMLQNNIPLMRDMDNLLQEIGIPVSESPMAGARSLLGELFMHEGEAMMAVEPSRQADALNYFENALAAFTAEWQLMQRAKRRDDAARERARTAGGPLEPSVATPERMRPYNNLLEALDEFGRTFAETAWHAEVAGRARALESGLRELSGNAREFDFEPGISPNLGIVIDENFEGLAAFRRGRLFLRPEEERKADAVRQYMRALTEYYNVFSDYSGSHWGASAGEVVARLRNVLFELTGRNVVIRAPGQEEKIAQVHIREGHNLFHAEKYAESIEKYLEGINISGEGLQGLVALASLMEAYARLEDTLMVRMLAHYVTERFADRPEAVQALLRIGRYYFDAGDMEMYLYVYELFLRQFPEHDMAPTILFMLGEQQWQVRDYRGAAGYYERVVRQYPESAQYLPALNRIGWGYFLSNNYSNAVEAFRVYLQEAPASREKAQAQLCLAESYRMSDRPVQALQAYRELIRWLEPHPNPYTGSPEERRQNQQILEQARFFQAYSFSQLSEPEDRIPQYREMAIAEYRGFVEANPESRLAPAALASLGAVYFERDRPEEAAAVFDELTRRYPDSEAGQNARFAMIRSLIDIGQLEKAKQVFEEMERDHERYSPGQFVRVGQLMLDRNEYAAAELAFLRVKNATEERNLLEPALYGLGRARFELGKFAESAVHLQDLIERYPRSGRFFEARFLLGRALAEQDRHEEAVRSLHDVFARARDAVLINRASLELAGLQLRGDQKLDALASYQRVVMFADPANPDVRPHLKQAILGSIRLYRDLERWDDVIANCDTYMRYFTLGDEAEQVRRWRSEALMRRAGS